MLQRTAESFEEGRASVPHVDDDRIDLKMCRRFVTFALCTGAVTARRRNQDRGLLLIPHAVDTRVGSDFHQAVVLMALPGSTAYQTGAVCPLLCDSARWHAWPSALQQTSRAQRRRLAAFSTAGRRRSRRQVACAADPQQLTRSFEDVSYDDLADSIGVPSRPTQSRMSGLIAIWRARLQHALPPISMRASSTALRPTARRGVQ